MRITRGKTWIDAEELAYNVPLQRSPRRGMVLFPDGKIRLVRLGVPDTIFTIPARGKAKGKTVSGFVHARDNWSLDNSRSAGAYEFVIPKTRKNPFDA